VQVGAALDQAAQVAVGEDAEDALVAIGDLGTVPAIARLNITFAAPEPGAGAVGAAAVGALGLLARRRARRS